MPLFQTPSKQQLARTWGAKDFPAFWQAHMYGSPGAPHGYWVPPLRPVPVQWHGPGIECWDDCRKALRIPADFPDRPTIPADGLPVDLLMRFDYDLANGTVRTFLLLGMVTDRPDSWDPGQIYRNSNRLRRLGVHDPIVLVMFSECPITKPTRRRAIDKNHILLLYRTSRPEFHGWQDDAQRKLRHVLSWS